MNYRFAVGLVFGALSLASAFAAPVITSFSPRYASASSPNFIMIQGSGFQPGALVVRFNGVAVPATATGPNTIQTELTANVPLGSGPIHVRVGNQETFSAEDFTVIGPGPYIHSFSPSGGAAGTEVTITGAQFNGTGNFSVRFNGILATHNPPSDNSVVAFAPAGVTTGRISVTRGTRSYTNQTLFYVNPVIRNFSPFTGRAGTNIIIRGTNFLGTTSVRIGNIPATFWVTNNNVIGAIIPPGALTGTLRIDTPSGNPAITSSNFVVQPTVYGFTPTTGNVGTSVTVTGANLNVGTPVVRFGSIQSPSVTAVTFDSLVATVPAGAATAPITVSTTAGSNTSSQLFYMPPRILSFNPTNGPAGTVVRVIGTNFIGATAVSFNGTPANFWLTNNGSLGVEVPSGVTTGPIFVTTPHSTTNSLQLFYGAPILTGFSPNHGLPGTNVLFFGTNFTGTTEVKFNGTNASFHVTNGVLTAVVPTNAVTGPVSVKTPAGTTLSDTLFTLDYTADLAVQIEAPGSRLLGSGDITYVITVSNRGPFAVSGVMLTNVLPNTVILKTASTTQGSLVTSGNPIRCDIGTLNVNGRAIVTVIVTPNVAAVIQSVATVSGGFPDPVAGNNSAVAQTTVFLEPEIGASVTASNVLRLAWSALLPTHVLESTSTPENPASWSPVTTPSQIENGQKVVLEPIGSGSMFYRLSSE